MGKFFDLLLYTSCCVGIVETHMPNPELAEGAELAEGVVIFFNRRLTTYDSRLTTILYLSGYKYTSLYIVNKHIKYIHSAFWHIQKIIFIENVKILKIITFIDRRSRGARLVHPPFSIAIVLNGGYSFSSELRPAAVWATFEQELGRIFYIKYCNSNSCNFFAFFLTKVSNFNNSVYAL